MMRRNM